MRVKLRRGAATALLAYAACAPARAIVPRAEIGPPVAGTTPPAGTSVGAAAPSARSTAPSEAPARPAPAAAPADGASLVDVALVDPTIVLDLRYATPNNFTGVKIYPVARCLLRRDVARRLAAVQSELRAEGIGLEAWDCYRPISVQKRFFDLVPDPRYVAEPVFENGRPIAGSKHNRGAAVDVTLVDATGRQLEMPTDFDDFSLRAHRDDTTATPGARRNAQHLEAAMVKQGFLPLATEWWHFDAPGWEAYELLDEPLPSVPGE
jgi:beta-N-acetylhexosaminidase/D-alanyl-D-alanine dipeptidase